MLWFSRERGFTFALSCCSSDYPTGHDLAVVHPLARHAHVLPEEAVEEVAVPEHRDHLLLPSSRSHSSRKTDPCSTCTHEIQVP